MEMVGHEGVGMDDPAEAPDGLGEDAEEHQVILVAEVDVAAIVAAGSDMPHGAGMLESEWSGHAPRLPRHVQHLAFSEAGVEKRGPNLLGIETSGPDRPLRGESEAH